MNTCAMRGRSSGRPVSFSTIDASTTMLWSSNPSVFFSSSAALACAARSSPQHLAVAAHQRDQRARGRAARAQAVGVGEQVALEGVSRQPQLAPRTPDRSPSPTSSALPATPAAARISATSSRFLPGGMITVTSSSAAPLTSVSRICFGVAGAAIS